MKQNLVGAQYEQLAKEQFCKIINNIPFVSDIEIKSTCLQERIGDFEIIVHFTDHESMQFGIEVKSSGERRFINMFMQKNLEYNSKVCLVFAAPYISEESTRVMREKKYSYMDLSGNCYIITRRIFLFVSGQPNKFIEKREKKNYLSKSAAATSVILRTMLNMPQRAWQVKTLAMESKKAIGTVSNVKSFLRDRDWIEENIWGFKLRNIKEILYVWAKDYHKKNARSYEFYSFEAVAELEQEIAEWSIAHHNVAVLGEFSAAARYAPTVRYKRVNIYVESQYFNEFIEDLDLRSVNSGGNVIITIPHDETPCMFARMINNSLVTSPVQTIIDLLGNAGRGEEAADAIIAKEYLGDGND